MPWLSSDKKKFSSKASIMAPKNFLLLYAFYTRSSENVLSKKSDSEIPKIQLYSPVLSSLRNKSPKLAL